MKKRRLSHSQMSAFLACPRKWFYSYIKKIKEPRAKALRFGNVVHKLMATAWEVMDINAAIKKADDQKSMFSYAKDPRHDQLLAEQLVRAGYKTLLAKGIGDFAFKLPMVIKIEQRLTIQEEAYDFIGYLDLMAWHSPEYPVIVDWKTTSRDYTEHDIITSEQLTAYAWLWWKIHGVVPAYVSYVTLDKNNADASIFEGRRQLTDLQQFEEKVESAARRMAAIESWRNPSACDGEYGRCYYYSMCWESRIAQHRGELTDF